MTDQKVKEINSYIGLNVGNSSENKPEEHIRVFSRGLLHGMKGERWNSLQWQAQEYRTQTEIVVKNQVDVRVYWDNEPHDMTFAEFVAWAESGGVS